jgi:hypothetical protein
MSDEWLLDFEAIARIRNARKVSEAVAIKVLIEACAEGIVRAWQRGCGEPKGYELVIPAAVWRGAHFADGVLHPAGTSPLNPYNDEGGYGEGVNGIIEFSAEDLHAWLSSEPSVTDAPSTKKRARPQRDRAKEIIDALWPTGVPAQSKLRNTSLLKRVNCSATNKLTS